MSIKTPLSTGRSFSQFKSLIILVGITALSVGTPFGKSKMGGATAEVRILFGSSWVQLPAPQLMLTQTL